MRASLASPTATAILLDLNATRDGNLFAVVSPYGQRTAVSLDANGYLASVSNPQNETWRFAYSDKGLITAAANARDNVSDYSYDEEGRVVSNRNAQGEGNTFMRNEGAEGLQLSKTDALSNTTRYTVAYSARGDTARGIITANGATATMIQQAKGAAWQTLTLG